MLAVSRAQLTLQPARGAPLVASTSRRSGASSASHCTSDSSRKRRDGFCGPGGYNAAIRLGQLGKRTLCVEKRGKLGGTCLNIGCIPSKALLHASELFAEAKHSFARMGITVSPSFDLPKMMGFKQEAIDGNTKGVDFLLKKNKVTVIRGLGKILGTGKIDNTYADLKPKTRKDTFTDRLIAAKSGTGGIPLKFTVGDGALNIFQTKKE